MGSGQRALRDEMAAMGYDTFLLNYSGALPRFVPLGTTIQSKYFCNILFSKSPMVATCWPTYFHNPVDL
jgi:hypothetical protein